MAKIHFKLTPAVHLFLVKDNNILLMRRYNTGFRDGEYSVIAGHLDGNEQATVAMAREASEEAGIIIAPQDLVAAHIMHRREGEERVDFFYIIEKWQGDPVNNEPHKCDDMQWFPLDNLPENIVPYVKSGIEQYFINQSLFSEFGWQ